MSGFRIITDLDVERVDKIARRTAKDQGFRVKRLDDDALSVCKGNLFVSILAGAVVAYCNFEIVLDESKKGDTKLTLERNKPWWTGLIGLSRVKKAAKALVDAIAQEIEDAGGEIMSKKEI